MMRSSVKPSPLSTIRTLKKASERSLALPLVGPSRITRIVSLGMLASLGPLVGVGELELAAPLPPDTDAPLPLPLDCCTAAGNACSMSSGVHSEVGSSAISHVHTVTRPRLILPASG